MTDDSRGQRRERPIWTAACFTAFTAKWGGEKKPKIYVGQFHIRQFQLRLFTRFIIRKFVTNFLWGAAGKGVKATFSVCLTFRGFPVGTAGPAAGDDGPFPHLRTLTRIVTAVAVKHFI